MTTICECCQEEKITVQVGTTEQAVTMTRAELEDILDPLVTLLTESVVQTDKEIYETLSMIQGALNASGIETPT